MSKFPQPCSVCGVLTKGESRCETHEREYRQRRNNHNASRPERRLAKSKLYNADYRRAAKIIRETATHCHLCKQPFLEGDRVEADHIIPNDVNSPVAAAHRLCNQRRGAKPL